MLGDRACRSLSELTRGGSQLCVPTIAGMGIGVYKAAVEYLLCKHFEEFAIDVLQAHGLLLNILDVVQFITINPFQCQNSLERFG